jgi:hypothetical protein
MRDVTTKELQSQLWDSTDDLFSLNGNELAARIGRRAKNRPGAEATTRMLLPKYVIGATLTDDDDRVWQRVR